MPSEGGSSSVEAVEERVCWLVWLLGTVMVVLLADGRRLLWSVER